MAGLLRKKCHHPLAPICGYGDIVYNQSSCAPTTAILLDLFDSNHVGLTVACHKDAQVVDLHDTLVIRNGQESLHDQRKFRRHPLPRGTNASETDNRDNHGTLHLEADSKQTLDNRNQIVRDAGYHFGRSSKTLDEIIAWCLVSSLPKHHHRQKDRRLVTTGRCYMSVRLSGSSVLGRRTSYHLFYAGHL